MRGFFSMAKRRVTTHSKVASARARVCVCACTQACAPRRPSSEHSYVGCQGCVFCFVFLFRREPSPVLRKCCRKRWELTPGSASVPLKKGPGLSGRSGEEREGKEEEGGWGGGGCCQPGYVTAMWVVVYTLMQTLPNTQTWPQSRLFLYAHGCQHAPSEIPCSKGEF